tara:strand:+ start:240 stop:536 length:297 start_codon:yes stop_codon:yes gene_type:complete
MAIKNRRKNAQKAVSQLSSIILNYRNNDLEIIDSAARQLISVGKRHGVRAQSNVTKLICRDCKKSLIPGKTARIRINSGQIITSCIRCNRVSRSRLRG